MALMMPYAIVYCCWGLGASSPLLSQRHNPLKITRLSQGTRRDGHRSWGRRRRHQSRPNPLPNPASRQNKKSRQ
ncbi:hypothetical protein DL93DRAFT_493464 [Clavulina sp. PMI_390]|nr:hypothetical protein DL93DRAFT_493464 [Clavulina sp. PMI_390]